MRPALGLLSNARHRVPPRARSQPRRRYDCAAIPEIIPHATPPGTPCWAPSHFGFKAPPSIPALFLHAAAERDSHCNQAASRSLRDASPAGIGRTCQDKRPTTLPTQLGRRPQKCQSDGGAESPCAQLRLTRSPLGGSALPERGRLELPHVPTFTGRRVGVSRVWC